MEREIGFCAHFWCMQVCEALNQHAYLGEPQGLGISPGGVPEVQGNSCCLLLIISHMTLLPFFNHTLSVIVCCLFCSSLCCFMYSTLSIFIPLNILFLFVSWLFLSVLSSVSFSLFLVLLHSVSHCSNKYDKWGYWCLKNELWSESLWCLTALRMYLDELMYSNFHFMWHTVLLLSTFFCSTLNGTPIEMCMCVFFPHFSWLSFHALHVWWQCPCT